MFSVRREAKGDFEFVLVQESRDGTKTKLRRWAVPLRAAEASDRLINALEEQLGVVFERVDMADVRTIEEFERRCRAAGSDVG